MTRKPWLWCTVVLLSILLAGQAWPARESNVRQTKHNLSSTGTGTLKATTETQVCVFCHTPHAATAGVTPLWNRTLSTATYTPYSSNSLDAGVIEGVLGQPGGSSKLCLSCHDGTLAIGNVNVLNAANSVAITMGGTGAAGVMAAGSGNTTGFTRDLGINLSNDHPISVTYTSTLVTRDGEMRAINPSTQKDTTTSGALVGVRTTGYKPKIPLEATGGGSEKGQVQCASCHDPHLRETNEATVGKQKFLRLNRFQENASGNGTYNQTNDIICLACHDKNQGNFGSWSYSAHANQQVSTQTYTAAAITQRDFPANIPVWRAACLNCHDTHTVPGARRLLREGTDSIATPKTGGNSAIEETCYQCHSASGTSILNTLTTVPNIKSDFALTYKMPITSANQAAGTEKHDIGGNFSDATFVDCTGTANKCGKDFIESRALLGVGALANRHAECTDCHNPHRVVKFKDFRGTAGSGSISGTPDASGTHPHTDTAMTHSNIASGVLRGTWGVEPSYTSNSFHVMPNSYTVKRGDPGSSTDNTAAATHLTREYQVCLKCHSDYGYSDNNTYPAGNRPSVGNNSGGTPSGTMGLTMFTNQAKEFQAPPSHATEPATLGNDGGSVGYNTKNHRSWHPVINATGRTWALRVSGGSTNPWRAPWNNATGTQTMYCTDCHGSGVTSTTSVIPDSGEDGNPWGPHGSGNVFLLKGSWNDVKSSDTNLLCFKCHTNTVYSGSSDSGKRSGFYDGSSGKGNLHNYHQNRIGGALRCTWCHVAVPHGWKNRSLLVNLNDVGEEAGQGAGSSKEVAINGSAGVYSQQPYYFKAKLKIASFATSGSWADTNCGSAGKSGVGLTTGIINGSGGAGNTTGTGKNWMTSTCSSPP